MSIIRVNTRLEQRLPMVKKLLDQPIARNTTEHNSKLFHDEQIDQTLFKPIKGFEEEDPTIETKQHDSFCYEVPIQKPEI